jgi:hypothetical protein
MHRFAKPACVKATLAGASARKETQTVPDSSSRKVPGKRPRVDAAALELALRKPDTYHLDYRRNYYQ